LLREKKDKGWHRKRENWGEKIRREYSEVKIMRQEEGYQK
jgi:hypothetical protein